MNDKIDREAADWVVRMEEADRPSGAREQTRWIEWLQRSPQHVQSYFDTADVYERLGKMDPHGRIDVDEWLAAGAERVVNLPLSGTGRPKLARRQYLKFAVAAGIAGVAVATALAGWQLSNGERYRTDVGQQSLYRLADGSTMTLNTRSQATIKFSANERLVVLNGEALFAVAPDATRPFFVRTSNATVRVIGTKFNVYGLAAETRVAVVEGRVQLSSGPQTAQPLNAGESARVSGTRIAKQATPNVDASVAWQQQKLVFEDATLAEVAVEFNRYNRSQIRVEPTLGATKRLSGTFDALHPQSLLLYLHKDGELTITEKRGDVYVAPRA